MLKKILNAFKASPKLEESLNNALIVSGLLVFLVFFWNQKHSGKPASSLIPDVDTRWFSKVPSARRLYELRDAVGFVLAGHEDVLSPTPDQWSAVKWFVETMKPLHNLSVLLEASRKTTISAVYCFLFIIHRSFLEFVVQNTGWVICLQHVLMLIGWLCELSLMFVWYN